MSPIGKVFVVLHNGNIIGGAFCLYTEQRSVYTLYYCSIREYHKRIFPAHLSILAAIDFGIKNGLEYLDFMGAGLKEKEYGVRQYKQEFGGEMIEYGRFRKVNNRFMFAIGEAGLWILRFPGK
jgi:lipid II:glycine glycyltransferase (peptidoglycan interpeptide bridge formation enzyme)